MQKAFDGRFFNTLLYFILFSLAKFFKFFFLHNQTKHILSKDIGLSSVNNRFEMFLLGIEEINSYNSKRSYKLYLWEPSQKPYAFLAPCASQNNTQTSI